MDADTFAKIIDPLRQRHRDYLAVFGTPSGQRVLADLARFCRASESTFHADPRIAANLDGRREVFLRIGKFTKLTADQIFRYQIGQSSQIAEGTDE